MFFVVFRLNVFLTLFDLSVSERCLFPVSLFTSYKRQALQDVDLGGGVTLFSFYFEGFLFLSTAARLSVSFLTTSLRGLTC